MQSIFGLHLFFMDLVIGDLVRCNRGRETASMVPFAERLQDIKAAAGAIIALEDQVLSLQDQLAGLALTNIPITPDQSELPTAVDAAVEKYCRTLSHGQAVELISFDRRRQVPFAIVCHTLHLVGEFIRRGVDS